MKLLAHLVTIIFLIYSLKAIADERLVDTLGDGPVEVTIDQKNESIMINSHEVDNRFFMKSKKVLKGGPGCLDNLKIMIIGDKLVIDYKQIEMLTFSSGNRLFVRELVEYVMSGQATIGGGPTGTHGGGK